MKDLQIAIIVDIEKIPDDDDVDDDDDEGTYSLISAVLAFKMRILGKLLPITPLPPSLLLLLLLLVIPFKRFRCASSTITTWHLECERMCS